jgi:hypothetical protein
VQVGVIRSSASLRDKLIVMANAEVAIRSFREADRAQLVQLWGAVFPDDPPRNAPARMINGALAVRPESVVAFYRALGYQLEERLSMGRTLV